MVGSSWSAEDGEPRVRKVLELPPWVGHILPGRLPQAQRQLTAPFLVVL